jgi:hypothetical protein
MAADVSDLPPMMQGVAIRLTTKHLPPYRVAEAAPFLRMAGHEHARDPLPP